MKTGQAVLGERTEIHERPPSSSARRQLIPPASSFADVEVLAFDAPCVVFRLESVERRCGMRA